MRSGVEISPQAKATKAKIVIAMRDLRKLGYFAKSGFRSNTNRCQDALADMNIDPAKVVYSSTYSVGVLDRDGSIPFSWSGDGDLIYKTFKNAGLIVCWNGITMHKMMVMLEKA